MVGSVVVQSTTVSKKFRDRAKNKKKWDIYSIILNEWSPSCGQLRFVSLRTTKGYTSVMLTHRANHSRIRAVNCCTMLSAFENDSFFSSIYEQKCTNVVQSNLNNLNLLGFRDLFFIAYYNETQVLRTYIHTIRINHGK